MTTYYSATGFRFYYKGKDSVKKMTQEIIDNIIKTAPKGLDIIVGFKTNHRSSDWFNFEYSEPTLPSEDEGFYSEVVAVAFAPNKRPKYIDKLSMDYQSNWAIHYEKDGRLQPVDSIVYVWDEVTGWQKATEFKASHQ